MGKIAVAQPGLQGFDGPILANHVSQRLGTVFTVQFHSRLGVNNPYIIRHQFAAEISHNLDTIQIHKVIYNHHTISPLPLESLLYLDHNQITVD